MPGRSRRGVVLAFDGLLVDSLPLRARAVCEAVETVASHLLEPTLDQPITSRLDTAVVLPYVAGRTFAECAREVMRVLRTLSPGSGSTDADETLVDLAALDATRRWKQRQLEVAVQHDAVKWTATVALRARVAIRADSERAFVEHVLDQAGLAAHIAMVVCADDIRTAGDDLLLHAQYRLLSERFDAQRISERRAVEYAGVPAPDAPHWRFHRVAQIGEISQDLLFVS